MWRILLVYIVLAQMLIGEYSVEEIREVAKKKYSHFDTKVDLLFNAYDEDENSTDNKVTLRVGIYDSDKRDRRRQDIEAFIEECITLQEDIKLARARVSFLKEQEEYYIAASEEDKKEAIVFERAINSSYIEKLFNIRERIFEKEYELSLAEEKLKARME